MKVIADDLAASGLFEEVRFIGDGAIPADADFVLGGDLKSTEFDVYATSYGLGMFGVPLWLLPIPAGKNEARVEIDLEMETSLGEAVWSGQLSGEGSKLFTLYSSSAPISNAMRVEIIRYARNDEGIDGDSIWAYHSSALRSGMEAIKQSLSTFIEVQP